LSGFHARWDCDPRDRCAPELDSIIPDSPTQPYDIKAVVQYVVDDGDFISAGGVTSGLDLALYLLERSYGPRIAHAVEELFEYERRGTVWKPCGREPEEF